jgi:SAM-dependent methyltransferase
MPNAKGETDAMTPYDRVRYPNRPYPRATPARLAAIARVHGVPAASPANCRVLEVGCGEAADLLPLAQAYPDSQFLGVDLAATAVAFGERLRAELGFANLTLRVADLRAVPDAAGPFDYILARGVFSWVPEEVRLELLALCRRLLAPAGVAFISYNALPGWHLVRMFREMMLAHVGDDPDPTSRADRARGLLRFVASGCRVAGQLGEVVRTMALDIVGARPGALEHDELGEINDPYYVSAFADLAARAGLAYLGEVDYFSLGARGFPPDVQRTLEELDRDDVVGGQQYRDFLHVRRYRQTLLVRAETPVVRPADPAPVEGLFANGDVRAEAADLDLSDGVPAWFISDSGSRLPYSSALGKAGLVEVGRRGGAPVGFAELAAAAAGRLGRAKGAVSREELRALAETLVDGFAGGLLVLEADPPRFAAAAGERPAASPLARAQLRIGEPEVTTLKHTMVKLDDPFLRALVEKLDGTRDRAALAAESGAEQVEAGLARASELALLVG